MSEDQLKAFVEKVKGDTSLQEKLKAASDADAVVSIAKEEGFSISIDDIKAQLLELSDEAGDVELSDEELEGVAGGVAVGELPASLREQLLRIIPIATVGLPQGR